MTIDIKLLARRAAHAAAALALAGGLAACGGGGDATSATDAWNTVPASALASPEAFSRFTASLAPDDHGDPMNVDNVTPPVSETDAPIAAG